MRVSITGELDVTVYCDYQDFLDKNPGEDLMATTKAKHVDTDVRYEPDCYIMFGGECRNS